jgi:hypothetical protein
MDLVAPVTGLDELDTVVQAGPDLIELRLDLVDRSDHAAIAARCGDLPVPLIGPSAAREGGAFTGDEDCSGSSRRSALARAVDLERRFRALLLPGPATVMPGPSRTCCALAFGLGRHQVVRRSPSRSPVLGR